MHITPLQHRYFKEAFGRLLLSFLWFLSHIFRLVGYKKPFWYSLSYFLQKTRLVDNEHYLRTYVDVEQQGYSPCYHFAAYGDKEGRSPNPLFEPRFYKSKARGRLKNVNSLLHYFYCGQYRRYSPSPWFDMQFYIANNRDVLNAGFEPLRHYLEFGGLEGRSPNPQFDGKFYLRQHPELAANFRNPLLHFIEYGRLNGLASRELGGQDDEVAGDDLNDIPKITHMTEQSQTIKALYEQIHARSEEDVSSQSDARITVDIIIPVYKNTLVTLQCIASVLQAQCSTKFELIIINDASPELDLSTFLEEFAELGILTLIKNSQNKGFVISANQGLQIHHDRDVILLNSDTQVFGNWIDRLAAAAYKFPNVASVTPLSNNATICSYPRTLHENPYPLEISYEDLDRLASKALHEEVVEAPTGVGFCFYINRSAIQTVGCFDDNAFGSGYGEENDWCQRALLLGWKNLIATDTFVYHVGGASFGGAKEKQLSRAMQVLAKRYPTYHRQIQEFIQRDPLRRAREQLDWLRLQLHVKSRNVLMVCHNRGGGSEKHLQEDAQKASKNGEGVFYMRPVRAKPHLVRIQHAKVKQLLNLPHIELKNTSLLIEKLKHLCITTVHTHGLVDFEASAPIYLTQFARGLNADKIVDLHDYKAICPRINLVDHSGIYCGEPSEHECNLCLSQAPNDFNALNIQDWRLMHYKSLLSAKQVNVPSQDAFIRLKRYFPLINLQLEPHEPFLWKEEKKGGGIKQEALEKATRVQVLIIGAISYIKGFTVLYDLAKWNHLNGQKIDYIVLGHTLNDSLLERYGVKVTGRYMEEKALDLVRNSHPDVIFFPAVWPETYSYTLDIALQAKVPIVAFDIGAIAERLKSASNIRYELMPLNNCKSPKFISLLLLRVVASPKGYVVDCSKILCEN